MIHNNIRCVTYIYYLITQAKQELRIANKGNRQPPVSCFEMQWRNLRSVGSFDWDSDLVLQQFSLQIRSGHDGTLPDEGKPSRKPPKTRGFLTTREIQARCGESCDRFPTCSSDSWWIAQIESQMSQLKIMRSEPKPGVMGFTNFVEEHA